MSVEAITWALRQPVSPSSAKFVLVVLANCASADTGVAYPSCAYIAQATSQDRKTVLANLARLIEWGLIEDTGKRAGATKQIVVYRVLCGPDLFNEQAQNRNSSESGTVPKAEQSQKPPKESRFSAKQSQKRDTEPSEPKEEPKATVQRDAAHGSEAFERWWAVYPKKVGKKPTVDKWKAKKLDAVVDRLVEDVEKRIAEDGRWLEGYIPNPATYLAQERWNDEIQPRRGAPQPVAAAPARDWRESSENPLERAINWARHQRHMDWIDDAECERLIAEATEKHREAEAA